jgi:RNA polymerase sigma-70 factor (ECF subfamily)
MDVAFSMTKVTVELDFEGLIAAEQRPLEALARRLVFDAEEARDVVQASFVQAWAQRHALRATSSARAWLRQMVVHRSLSLLRRRRLWGTLAMLLRVEPEPLAPPDEGLETHAHRVRLARALESLSPKQSAAFSLRYLEGLSLDEVAEAMRTPRGTARVHLQRAVKALRAFGVLPAPEVP